MTKDVTQDLDEITHGDVDTELHRTVDAIVTDGLHWPQHIGIKVSPPKFCQFQVGAATS